MKTRGLKTFGWTLLTLTSLTVGSVQAQNATVPANLSPNAAEVVRLAGSGVGEDVVLAYVKNASAPFNLSAEQVLDLKNANVSSTVLAAMLNHDAALRANGTPNSFEQKLSTPSASAAATPSVTAPTPAPVPAIPTLASAAPASSGGVTTTSQVPLPATQFQQPSVVIDQAPPPPRTEIVPLAPGADYVWVPGYWSWRAGNWYWIGGTYVLRPQPATIWLRGHWAHHGREWIWVSGRWR